MMALRTSLHESDARSKLVWSKSDRVRPAAIDAMSPKSNALASCSHRASSSGQLTPLVGCLNAADIDMSSSAPNPFSASRSWFMNAGFMQNGLSLTAVVPNHVEPIHPTWAVF